MASIFGSGSASESAEGSPRGLYIYGGVGTGKTMMMDLFYQSVSVEKKRRVHFHEFMLEVHGRSQALKDNGFVGDPIPKYWTMH